MSGHDQDRPRIDIQALEQLLHPLGVKITEWQYERLQGLSRKEIASLQDLPASDALFRMSALIAEMPPSFGEGETCTFIAIGNPQQHWGQPIIFTPQPGATFDLPIHSVRAECVDIAHPSDVKTWDIEERYDTPHGIAALLPTDPQYTEPLCHIRFSIRYGPPGSETICTSTSPIPVYRMR